MTAPASPAPRGRPRSVRNRPEAPRASLPSRAAGTRKASRLTRLAYLLLSGLVLGLLALAGWTEWRAYEGRNTELQTSAANLARSLLKDMEGTFGMADTALVSIVEQLEIEGLGPAGVAQIGRLTRRHLENQPVVRDYSVYDRNGDLILTSHTQGSAGVNVSDRAYFRAHRENPTSTLQIGVPVRSRMDGQWVLTLSRAFLDRGRFGGVAVASIEVAALARSFNGYALGGQGSIDLLRSDGRLLARTPPSEGVLSNAVLSRSPYREPIALHQSGTFRMVSPIDAVDRIGAYQSGERYPLALMVGHDAAEATERWLRPALTRAAAAVLLGGLLIVLGHQLIRQAKRRLEAERVLAESEAHFRLLTEHASDLVARIGADHRIRYASPASGRLLGRAPDQLVGLLFEELADPEHRPALRAALERAGSARPQADVTWRVTRPGGASGWIETTIRRTGARGAGQGFVTVSRDVTERKAMQEHMAALAATDGLTGLANRRRFDEMLDVEWRRAAREGQWISVLLMDVDCFKLFNDRYGHLAGDDALRGVAAAVDGAIRRPGDLAARYGGEEFAVILPNTDGTGAREVAERVRLAVANLRIPHQDSATGHVTSSIGMAALQPVNGTAPDLAMLLGAADAALYAAKKAGRNRVGEAPSITVLQSRRATGR